VERKEKHKQISTSHSEPTATVKQSTKKNKNPIYLHVVQAERKENFLE